MKGYKAFNEDLTCKDMQYEIGKEYTFDGEPIPCEQGFHFCKSITDCYLYYPILESTRICEIDAFGDIETNDNVKYCTNKIKIIKEIKNPRSKSNKSKTSSGYCNSGDDNSGNFNSGYRNSGHFNSGNFNSGHHNSDSYNSGNFNSGCCNSGDYNSGSYNSASSNSGDYNSGIFNTGNYNSGRFNTGHYNSGDHNSGTCNSGNYNSGFFNSGDYNSGNYNSGIFNTDENPKIKIFDQDSEWTIDDWNNSQACRIMMHCPFDDTEFISSVEMTDEEKEQHPEYKTTKGYLRINKATNEEKQQWWDNLSDEDKQHVLDLPNFNAEKFEICTGIKVNQ